MEGDKHATTRAWYLRVRRMKPRPMERLLGAVALAATLTACTPGPSLSSPIVTSTTSSPTPVPESTVAPTTTMLEAALSDPALIAGEWLVSFTGVEQYPEQLFFYWQPGDRWGLWRWELTPTCPEAECPIALAATNLLYGPGEEAFDVGEFVYSDGVWTLKRDQEFTGGCLPSDASDRTNDDSWHFDAFTGSELELTATPTDLELVGGSWLAGSLEVTRVETGVYTEEAAAACDVPVFSRSVATALPFAAGTLSVIPEPSHPQTNVLAVSHEVGSDGMGISLFDLSAGDYMGLEANTNLGLVIEDGTLPAWSPDGTMIAYTVYPADAPPEVWVTAGDGSDPRFLAIGYEPVWSPDGSMIVVRRDGDRNDWTDLYIVFLPGGQVEQALFRGWSGDAFFLEAGRLAVSEPAQRVVWAMDREDPYVGFDYESEQPLLAGAVGEAHRAGDQIFYAGANEVSPEFGDPRVVVASLTGVEQTRMFWNLPSVDAEWAVSPDGSLIAVPRIESLDLVTVVSGGDYFTYVNRIYPRPNSVAWSPTG